MLPPLNVVYFSPLVSYHAKEVTERLYDSQAVLRVENKDLFCLFYVSQITTSSKELVLIAFGATGVPLPNPHVMLDRCKKNKIQLSHTAALLSGPIGEKLTVV
ncbi:hypothetical protein M3J09_006098 [Ascochyta lentis]